jgi:excisionase family DNA binding protein
MKKRVSKREATDIMSPEEAAKRLGIGRNQIYGLLQLDKIPALRFGRRWLIPREAFEKMLSGETKAA